MPAIRGSVSMPNVRSDQNVFTRSQKIGSPPSSASTPILLLFPFWDFISTADLDKSWQWSETSADALRVLLTCLEQSRGRKLRDRMPPQPSRTKRTSRGAALQPRQKSTNSSRGEVRSPRWKDVITFPFFTQSLVLKHKKQALKCSSGRGDSWHPSQSCSKTTEFNNWPAK